MKHFVALPLVLLGIGGFIALQSLTVAAAPGPHAASVAIDGTIDNVSARYLSRAFKVAGRDGARFLIVSLDTPGGLFDSTREMVEDIRGSDIPVIVYVSPPGARAASAGTFITAAAHVAAMAPTTNIGAASPVGGGGEDLPETLKSKATQDAAAFIRSIAQERRRNAEALEQTVLSAKAYSASEALDNNIIDIIASDVDDLLTKLHGWTVEIKSGEVVLETEGLEVRNIGRTALERFLGVLADPNIAFLLLTIGGIGILVELMHPGLIAPGLAGVIALALAFVAIGTLPVNWVGVGLIALAMVLFFLEFQAPGIGVFGVGGGVSFVLGAFFLFGGLSPPPITTPSFRVSLWAIGSVSVVLFAFLILLFRAVLDAKRMSYYSTCRENLVGQTGTTTTPLDPHGTVRVAGELWSAVSDSDEPIPQSEDVIVSKVEGLTLKVFKASIARE